MSPRRIIIHIAFSFVMFTTICVGRELADLVEANWINIEYTKNVLISNPRLPIKKQTYKFTDGLYLSCEIDIKDPNIIIGTCDKGIVTELTDKHGRKIDLIQKPPDISMMLYSSPDYKERYIQPAKIPRWQKILLSIPGVTKKTQTKQKHVFEIQPNKMYIELNTRVIEKSGGKIKSLKGYFHVLSARGLDYIDIPFEPNSNWVYLTPDMQIQIFDAQCTQSGPRISYNYEIKQRWRKGKYLPCIGVSSKLPSRIVTGYQLIDTNGKTVYFSKRERLPADLDERRSVVSLSNIGPIEKFQFVVGVNVTHRRIPFEFINISMPNP